MIAETEAGAVAVAIVDFVGVTGAFGAGFVGVISGELVRDPFSGVIVRDIFSEVVVRDRSSGVVVRDIISGVVVRDIS